MSNFPRLLLSPLYTCVCVLTVGNIGLSMLALHLAPESVFTLSYDCPSAIVSVCSPPMSPSHSMRQHPPSVIWPPSCPCIRLSPSYVAISLLPFDHLVSYSIVAPSPFLTILLQCPSILVLPLRSPLPVQRLSPWPVSVYSSKMSLDTFPSHCPYIVIVTTSAPEFSFGHGKTIKCFKKYSMNLDSVLFS